MIAKFLRGNEERISGSSSVKEIRTSKILFVSIFLLLSEFTCALQLNVYDVNPEDQPNYVYHKPKIQGNLSNFADEKVIVLYRGVHCLSDKFSNAARLKFLTESHINKDMYSSAAFELAKVGYNDHDDPALLDHAQAVAESINDLDFTDSITVKNYEFTNQRFAFQQLYSNNCNGFYNQLKAPGPEYIPIFEDFEFTKNPLLSFSDRVKHPGKYGFGIKNFGDSHVLSPEYDSQGRPKHPVLGKLFGVVLDEAAVEELKPLNVAKAHYSDYLSLNNHFRNDILSEREISIAGYVPGENVVFEMPLQVPSFHYDTCPNYYQTKYGLSNARYNNYRKVFRSAQTTGEVRAAKTTKLINEIIEATHQDNNLRYMNCLAPSIPNLFGTELSRQHSKIGNLTLDYTIE